MGRFKVTNTSLVRHESNLIPRDLGLLGTELERSDNEFNLGIGVDWWCVNIRKNVATHVSSEGCDWLLVNNLRRQTKSLPTHSWSIRSVNQVNVFIPAPPFFLCRIYLQIRISLSF